MSKKQTATTGGVPLQHRRTPSVLLVENHEELRRTYHYWLQDHDDPWAVAQTASGDAALDRLDGTFDAVVLDRSLDEGSGDAVHRRLDETTFDGAVVVVSSSDPDESLDEDAVDAYLTKITDREAFLRTLTDLIDR